MAKKDRQKQISVGFVALGCAKNIIDSEKMLAEIGQAGFVLTGDTENVDVVVINTCGFIEPARQEALEAIETAIEHKKKGRVKKVIVAGCLAQRMGRQLTGEIDGIDAVIGLGARADIVATIRRILDGTAEQPIYINNPYEGINDDTGRLLLTPPHRAYLRISEGCNRRCSFCTIPAIRGHFRSKPEQMILAEAQELAASGVVELSIIAQDSTSYGKDLAGKSTLAGLLKKLAAIDGIQWLRLMYLYPSAVDSELIETIAGNEKIVNYFDIPIQHINDEILRRMRRSDTKKNITALIEKIRANLPDAVLRTTLITGFPGETDEQFQELLDFIDRAGFDALGCFTFYAEQGTPAAELDGQIPDKIKAERLETLMLRQRAIAFDKAASRIGDSLTCIVDSTDDSGQAVGRFFGQAPDIDSVCLIENCFTTPGRFVVTEVKSTRQYDLVCNQISH